MSEVNSVIKPVLAELLAPSTLMAEPVASIAPFSPFVLSSPNTIVSLPIWSMAPSPRSSPRATLILSAASTKPSISFLPWIPKRPAAPASAFSSSRGVRVVICLKVSFISSTSAFVWPVYFITSVIASSILAKLWTYWSAHATIRSLMAKALVMAKPIIFILPRKDFQPLFFSNASLVPLISSFVFLICSVTDRSSAVYRAKSSVPGFSWRITVLSSFCLCVKSFNDNLFRPIFSV